MLLAAEAARGGWAHLVALLVAVLVAVVAINTHQWWTKIYNPSPPPPEDDEIDVTPGETDDPDPDDTDDDTPDDTEQEGRRIVTLADGSRVVRYVSRAPADPDDPDDNWNILGDDEPDEGAVETREEMADRLLPLIEAERCSYSDAVREIMNAHDVSETTAKRDIRNAKERVGA